MSAMLFGWCVRIENSLCQLLWVLSKILQNTFQYSIFLLIYCMGVLIHACLKVFYLTRTADFLCCRNVSKIEVLLCLVMVYGFSLSSLHHSQITWGKGCCGSFKSLKSKRTSPYKAVTLFCLFSNTTCPWIWIKY